jgi:predicted AAA+ superfamily ATPase
MIKRDLRESISRVDPSKKVIIILGPRQVGKSTLLDQHYRTADTLYLNGDDASTRAALSDASKSTLERIVSNHDRIIIDEAQRINNIGLSLKILHDQVPGKELYITGSSALDLQSEISESLTGRKREFCMLPLSISEMVQHHGYLHEMEQLDHRLVYGYYPEVINQPGHEKETLLELANSYLYKDIFALADIKKPKKLEMLVQAIALQLGSEVSHNELADMVQLDNETVGRYINLLEKTFVLFRLSSLSRNLRNEIKKKNKYYFYDLGIRNALLNNWSPFNLRIDKGGIWENFVIIERLKYKHNHGLYTKDYFWRTHKQHEIDYVEEVDGVLHAYEIKYNPKRKAKWSQDFKVAYPSHTLNVVHRDNLMDFVEANHSV